MQHGRTVGVIAVDPSSRRTRGALLGDRTRIDVDPEDQGVFVRSLAARDRLGGLADLAAAAMVLMRAVYDVVLVETVGVGQSETEIAEIADTVVFAVQPGSGDSLQFMKAGIVEIPDIALVTKADLGAIAERAKRDLEGALGIALGKGGWLPPVLLVSATTGQGVDAALDAVARHQAFLAPDLGAAARGAGRGVARALGTGGVRPARCHSSWRSNGRRHGFAVPTACPDREHRCRRVRGPMRPSLPGCSAPLSLQARRFFSSAVGQRSCQACARRDRTATSICCCSRRASPSLRTS